jgi:hypothetical protein
MARPWTAQEDAILREHAAKGPGYIWDHNLLPGRGYTAICSRRQKLGIQFEPGTTVIRRSSKPRKPVKPVKPWTEQQRCAMLFHATAMAKDSGHTFAECITELARLQREHRKQR